MDDTIAPQHNLLFDHESLINGTVEPRLSEPYGRHTIWQSGRIIEGFG